MAETNEEVIAKRLAEYKTLRRTAKAAITRIFNVVDEKCSTFELVELECRLSILDSYFKQFLNVQSEIEKLSDDTSEHDDIRAEVEDTYVATRTKIEIAMIPFKPSVERNETSSKPLQSPSIRVNLPYFEGNYSEFSNFYGLFKELIHKNASYSVLEKFNELRNHLRGPALSAISNLEVKSSNYTNALRLLEQRFDNKNIVFQEHIQGLFNLKKVDRANAKQLRELIDTSTSHISALNSSGSSQEILDAVLIHLVTQKLDNDTRQRWEESIDFSKLSKWSDCSDIISKRCQNLEARLSLTKEVDTRNKWKTSTSLQISQANCSCCNNNSHSIENCYKFKNMEFDEKFKLIKKLGLCLQCLKKGHLMKNCTDIKCLKCNESHHELLHRDKQHTSLSTLSDQNEYCFLATAVVKVQDVSRNFHSARILLDSASQMNFVSESFAQLLKLKRTKDLTEVTGVGDVSSTIKCKTNIVMKSRLNNFEAKIEAFIIPKITGIQPAQQFDISQFNIPSNVKLADPQFFKPAKIDILLGADHFYDVLSVGQIKLGENLPTLQKTLLGWVVSGSFNASPIIKNKYCNIVSYNNMKLEELVENFWRLEEISQNKVKYSEEELKCEEFFENNVQHQENLPIIVKLPFKMSPNVLGDTRVIAEKRFLNLEKKLNKNIDLKSQYTKFIEEYEALNHMERVCEEDMKNVKYYAPHHPVIRPESTTTKLRVVFDCSCKSSTNISLNELLMRGPTVQNELFEILLKFRQYKYAISADIVKMYRQILVFPEDKMYQCILWRSSTEEKIATYKLNTVTYGTTSAPYLATKALCWLAEKYKKEFPIGSEVVKSSFYVDDLIGGCNSLEELINIRSEVTALLKYGNFELKKWYSNEISFLEQISEGDKQKTLRINDCDIIKTLGMMWEPVRDEFQFVAPEITNPSKITKRVVLSQMSQLFDPLGIVNPVIVKAKIFMQDLWKLKIDWDESLPIKLHELWATYLNQLKHLSEMKITRCVVPDINSKNIEIHGFSDSSDRAYGACIYIRCIQADDKIKVNLLCAKSRVAPVKTKSLPRLELCAAELLVELLQKFLATLVHQVNKIYLWCDSKIVLNWLSAHPSAWSVFVSHRVAKIQELSKNCIWRYVNTNFNPADIISRGATVKQLKNSIWFTGPDFLMKTEDFWPEALNFEGSLCDDERRKTKISLILAKVSNEFESNYTWCNDFEKIIRRFVFIIRIYKRFLRKDVNEINVYAEPTAAEVDEAFLKIIWHIQQTHFREEIQALENKNNFDVKSNIKNLNPFLDTSSQPCLLKVGGRLVNAEIPDFIEHPILLPTSHQFTKIYLTFLHFRNHHAGPQALVSTSRQRVWIVNSRKLARSIVNKCIHCVKYRPKIYQQIMGNLPSRRVIEARAFLNSGVDFCGPFLTSLRIRGKPPYKTYIAVFVCFSTKSVHLEVVSDLSSWGFIAALKRFVARRGKCQQLYCDNGTNFVGGKNQLNELREKFLEQQTQNRIAKWCASDGIQFHHIPPRAPHFGGIWEAAVKSAKKHLYTTIQNSKLTYEELCTITAEIESILNSRPIAPMSSDPSDEQALTPGHFLIGGPLNQIVEPSFQAKGMSHQNRWRFLCELKQHFWNRWAKEYLLELQVRSKWHYPFENAQVGQLVLIAEKNVPSQQWLVGRIIELKPGDDDKVRVVKVKTKNGEILCAIDRLAPLPVNE